MNQLIGNMQDFQHKVETTSVSKQRHEKFKEVLEEKTGYLAQHLSYEEIAKLAPPLQVSVEKLEEIKEDPPPQVTMGLFGIVWDCRDCMGSFRTISCRKML